MQTIQKIANLIKRFKPPTRQQNPLGRQKSKDSRHKLDKRFPEKICHQCSGLLQIRCDGENNKRKITTHL